MKKSSLVKIWFSLILAILIFSVSGSAVAVNSTANNTTNNTNITSILAVNGTWNNTFVDINATMNSITLDSAGYAHIAYMKHNGVTNTAQNTNLFYVYQDENGWHIEVVDDTEVETGRFPSIALDSNGYPHISYESLSKGVRYAYKDASGWHIQNVVNSLYNGGDAYGTNLVLFNDQPYITFYDYTLDRFIYAHWDGASWIIEHINDETSAQEHGVDDYDKGEDKWSSIAVDSNGVPHVSYYSLLGKTLYYATRTGPNNWQYSIVDSVDLESANPVGLWNSIALDPSGNPGISYGVYNTGILKYAHWNGTSWNVEQVVDTGDVPLTQVIASKLKYTSSGIPIIAFQRPSWEGGCIALAYKEGSNWISQNISGSGSTDPSHVYLSLSLDSFDFPHISYQNGNGRLRYAYFAPLPPTVSTTTPAGYYNAPVNVNLSVDQYGNTIYYTLDGSNPRTSSTRVLYTVPINISSEGATILKYAALGYYNNWSNVTIWNYIIDTNAPFVNSTPTAGDYNTIVNVDLTANETANIYYTLDGSNPITSPTRKKYSLPVKLATDGTITLTYAAVDLASNWSGVYSKIFNLKFPSASITVSNNGTGTISALYYMIATMPDGQKIYNKLTGTLNAGKTFNANLGKYPVGTTFTWIENIYNNSTLKQTINVTNQFLATNRAAYIQIINMTNVPSSYLVYAVEEIKLTDTSIEATEITPPAQEEHTTAPTVAITPDGGIYDSTQSVTLITTDPDSLADTYYTTDGSDPKTKGILYKGPIAITRTTTLRYLAVDPDGNFSPEYTQTFTLYTIAPAVTADPIGKPYNTTQTITLTSDPTTAIIYYTLDGSDPKTNGILYNGPFEINDTVTLRYIAVDPAGNWSPEYTQNYTRDNEAPTVSVSPVGGTYSTGQMVTLTSSDPTATIYVTIDGSDPQINGRVYANTMMITGNTTVRYIARDPAGNWSPQYMQVYDAGGFVIGGQNPGPSSGVPGALITTEIEPNSAVHVGDQIVVHVTIYNTGSVFFSDIQVLIPVPNGLIFVSKTGGGISNTQWDPVTQIWYPGNMRPESRGQQKNIWITFIVGPELEGQVIQVQASFLHIYYVNSEGNVIQLGGLLAPSATDSVPVTAPAIDNNGGSDGNGDGGSIINSEGGISGWLFSSLNSIAANSGSGDNPSPTGDNPIDTGNMASAMSLALQMGVGGQEGGKEGDTTKTYEVIPKINTPQIPTVDYFMILAIIAVIGGGYFYGTRRRRF